MLPFVIFTLFGLSMFLIGGDDVADDTGDETPDPDDTETVPVDSIYDDPEIDPETGAFLVAPGQAVQGTGGDDLFTLVEGMDYSYDHDEDNSVTIAAGDGNDEIIFDGYAWGSINGGADDDVIRTDNWGGNINGGDGDDDIQISNGYGLFEGGAGNDFIVNGGDRAVLYGGDGDDHLIYGSFFGDRIELFGGAGNDIVDGREVSNFDLFGGDSDDVLLTSQNGSQGA